MKTFGEILRFYIEQSGLSIYQFSRLAGINRTNLQRYLSDQRFPAPEIFEILLAHLQLRSDEQSELMNAYEIARIGENLYFQRRQVKQLLESFSIIYENEQQKASLYQEYHPVSVLLFSHEKLCHFIHGHLSILHLLQAELSRIIKEQDAPSAYLFLPVEPNTDFLNAAFTSILMMKEHPLQIRQLFSLSKSTAVSNDASSHNLKVLSILLPLCFSFQFQYQAYFYYDNYLSSQNYGILYPYYAILNDRVIFLSSTLDQAMICSDKDLVSHYKQLFTQRLENCQTFIQWSNAYPEIVDTCNLTEPGIPDETYTEYTLIYHPCLTSVGSEELARELLWEEIPNREEFLALIGKRISLMQDPANPPHHFFSEKGLIDFLTTGNCMEFPKELVKQVPPELRLVFLKRLREFCAEDRQVLRITNPNTFSLPEYLSFNVVELRSSVFMILKEGYWNVISIPETSIHLALLDFMSHFADSPYVYSKEETLDILDKHIRILADARQ